MRCSFRCKFLLLFLLISALALSSAFILRALVIRDFARYLDGESQDKVQRVIAMLEGDYNKQTGWQRSEVAKQLAWALQLGVVVGLYDATGVAVMDSEQAVATLSMQFRNRVLDASGFEKIDARGRGVAYPLYLRGEEIGHVEVQMLEQVKEAYFVRSSNHVLIISVSALGLLSIIAGMVASRRLARPVLELVDASGAIAEGNLSRRVTVTGHDEIARLSASFNSMAHRLEAQEKLRRTLLANAAHELRTPLAIISGELEGMIDGVLPSDQAALVSLHEEARRLTAILDGVDDVARAEASSLTLNRECFALQPYLTTLVSRFDRLVADKHAVLLVDCPVSLEVYADPDRLSQVIINLLSNSIRALAGGGRVTVVAYQEGEQLVMVIADNGCGIAEADIPHLFERFYKGKNGGLGLGLTIVQELVAAHEGSISVTSEPGQGASFRITLPGRAAVVGNYAALD